MTTALQSQPCRGGAGGRWTNWRTSRGRGHWTRRWNQAWVRVLLGLSQPGQGQGRALQGGELRRAAAGALKSSPGCGDRPRLLIPAKALPVPSFRFRARPPRHIRSRPRPPSLQPGPGPTPSLLAQPSHPKYPGPASGLLPPNFRPRLIWTPPSPRPPSKPRLHLLCSS